MRVSRLFAATSLAFLAACQTIAGLDGEFTKNVASGGQGAGGDLAQGGGGASGGCVPKTPPAPPDKDDATDNIAFTMAVRSIDLHEDTGVASGFDLDGRCTCDGSTPADAFPSSCKMHAKTEATDLCDAPDGVDGQSARIFHQFVDGGFDSTRMSDGAEHGYWSVLIRVEGYNGSANDTQVAVSVYNAAPRYDPPPLWDGSDVWPIDPASLADGMSVTQPLYHTDSAYVAGGKLVLSLDSSALVFFDGSGGYLQVRLSGAIVTGTLEAVPGGGYRMADAVLSGKWPQEEVFNALDDFRVNGVPICTTDFSFTFLKNALCPKLDVNRGAPNVAEYCDALSFGLTFVAEPAQLGVAGMLLTPTPGCPPETLPSTAPCSLL